MTPLTATKFQRDYETELHTKNSVWFRSKFPELKATLNDKTLVKKILKRTDKIYCLPTRVSKRHVVIRCKTAAQLLVMSTLLRTHTDWTPFKDVGNKMVELGAMVCEEYCIHNREVFIVLEVSKITDDGDVCELTMYEFCIRLCTILGIQF